MGGGGVEVFLKILFLISRFMLFTTLKKILKSAPSNFRVGGGGGGGVWERGGGGVEFFFRETILSHFTFYAIFNIKKQILSLTG